MTKKTINEALVLTKIIRERINELRHLRDKVSVREDYLYGKDEKKTIEPLYDVKAVDRKVTELQKFILEAESAIKTSNAVTFINLDTDTGKLLDPIE